MRRHSNSVPLRLGSMALAFVLVAAVNAQNIGQLIKVIGVGAVVKQFGGEMNREINKLTGHVDTEKQTTKVVPIISLGLNSRKSIGAAQISGARSNIEKVKCVASPQVDLFGHEITVRALIPVATDNPTDAKNLKPVDGVGVTGIVDLKL
ncbi:MAG: hypothetical protein ABUL72_03670 [Armatimonadota bacterium]